MIYVVIMDNNKCTPFIFHFYLVLFLLIYVNIRLYIFIECVHN